MAPGRRAPRRAHRCRRAAEVVAVHVPAAARLEGPARGVADPGADLGIGAAGGRGDGVGRAQLGRPVRLARTRPAASDAPAGSPTPSRPGRRTAPGSSSPATRPRASPRSSPRRTTPSRSATRSRTAPPPGAIALIARSLNGGFTGGPDGLTFVTDRELFGTVRVRRPKALRRVVPRDILERLTPGDLVVHIDHGVARYEQMLRRGGSGRRARLPGARVRGRRPDLRPGGADRPGDAVRRRRAAAALQAGRHGMASGQATGPQRRRRPRRRAARAVRRPCQHRRPRLRRRHALAGGDGGLVPVRGDHRPAARRGRGQGGHGAAATHGPPGRRRRGLRQDRGRAARRVQGDAGRQAGRGPRAHHRPRRPAPRDVQPAVRGVPAGGPTPVAVRQREGAGGHARRPHRRHRGPRHRDASAAEQGRAVQGPRAWSSSTRSSASAWRPRSGSSSSVARWTS